MPCTALGFAMMASTFCLSNGPTNALIPDAFACAIMSLIGVVDESNTCTGMVESPFASLKPDWIVVPKIWPSPLKGKTKPI